MTLYPEPEINMEMPAPHFLKYRRAINAGIKAFNESRNRRIAIAAKQEAEFHKMDKFLRNCAINGRIETSGW
tara:strand:+ start:1218 stop:1433 length:216 start_codon:yes stop_codon:yes gene_type:complete